MMTGIGLCFVIMTSYISITSGSKISLTMTPATIQQNLTSTMTLRCGLSDTHNINNSSNNNTTSVIGNGVNIIGRRRRRSTDRTDDDVRVLSILVTRDGRDVASVSAQVAAYPMEDLGILQVSGDVANTPGDRAFLELWWTYPGSDQSGEYVCEVTTVDSAGHTTVLSRSLGVDAIKPSLTDLVSHVQDLQILTQQQAAAMQAMNDVIKDMNSTIQGMNSAMSKTHHVESGQVLCNSNGVNSDHWPHRDLHHEWTTVTLTFDHPYDTPPVIHLGGVTDFQNYGFISTHNAFITDMTLTLVSVTQTDFTVMCRAPANIHGDKSGYFIARMSANWVSFYNPDKL